MRWLPLLGFVGGMTGCLIGFVAPAPVGGVTFVVFINPGLFATGGTLSADVWNASQLAILDDNARCASVNGPGGTQVQCPPGVTYKEVVPEHMDVPLSSLTTSFEMTPKQVGPGERFRMRLSAPTRDRCNSSSADLVRTAEQGRTELRDWSWQTTLRACVTPP